LGTAGPAAHSPVRLKFADEPEDETVGQHIGPYKILEKVGEGGCGVVHVTGKTQLMRQQAAPKVIKLVMDRPEVIARFEVERPARAMMDHPNITEVLDPVPSGWG
jgi:hypothetical protein